MTENQPSSEAIARPNQLLMSHLMNVGRMTEAFTHILGLSASGKLVGILHDLGKYSKTFQGYIASATHLIASDNEDFVDAKGLKGKIDHSTAGAQWVWRNKAENNKVAEISAQILSLCIASHHSGLIDCLSSKGKAIFISRIDKKDERTFYSEVTKCLSDPLKSDLITLIKSSGNEFQQRFRDIAIANVDQEIGLAFHFGLLTRLMLSCLVDADRLDSAGREYRPAIDWESMTDVLELHLQGFDNSGHVNTIRKEISDASLLAAQKDKQFFFLTVPTGGGKTLASLRFALHHAKKHCASRIFYIVPYTSIIEQNAKAVRDILAETGGDLILEHHSNLTSSVDTDVNRLLAENWDSPIIFTTTVQFLEALFGSGTRGLRRMHRLSNAVLIFDEPQALPIKVTHLFNQAANFLKEQCGSSLVFCTATQPLLHRVCPEKGALKIHADSVHIVPDTHSYFVGLKRVQVLDLCKVGGYSCVEVAEVLIEALKNRNSILLVVNTKVVARRIFEEFNKTKSGDTELYHLSTNMCPMHRQDKLTTIRQSLDQQKQVVCISTQLIEAGVDISFQCVFRSLSGIDSIAQAAGRCNRNGEMESLGEVFIVNCNEEHLASLPEIKIAQEKTERILREFNAVPDDFDHDLIGLKAIERYYQLYFFDRSGDMDYPIEGDSLLSQLSTNALAVKEYERINNASPPFFMMQSFSSAGNCFEVIDAPTEGIIVPYNQNARDIIGKLCGKQWEAARTRGLLKEAQRYSVNIFASDRSKLLSQHAIQETQPESGVYYLDDRFYTHTYGITMEGSGSLAFLST